MSDVAVVMSAYREDIGQFREAVDSILNQSFRDFDFLIVLDDPENLGLRREAEAYLRRDTRIQVLVNEVNLGLARSLNHAISQCSAAYVCRMDADDVSLPDRLERQLALLERGGYDLVGGCVEVIDEFGEPLYLSQGLPKTPDAVRKALRWNNCVPHPTWVGKRWVFDQGYRDISLCEDYDLLIRTTLAGGLIANASDVVLKYRMGEESISRSNLYEQYLYMRYLTSSYAHGRAVDIDCARAWVGRRNNPSRSQRYLAANSLFNEMMVSLGKRQLFQVAYSLLRIATTSPAYVNKMVRLLMATLQRPI